MEHKKEIEEHKWKARYEDTILVTPKDIDP